MKSDDKLQTEITQTSESLQDNKPQLQENSQVTLQMLDMSLDADNEAKEIEDFNEKLHKKVKKKKVTILVLLIIIIILLLKSCGSGDIELPRFETSEYVEQDDYPKHVDGYTAIPVVDDFTVSTTRPYIALYNPETNKGYSYLQYKFTNIQTGEVIFESGLVEPGQKFSVAFGELLGVGEYDVFVEILNFDYKDYTKRKNGGQSQITITVNP